MKEIADRTEPLGYSYVGKAEKCTYEFRSLPEQIPGESWLAEKIIERNSQEIENQGCRMLRIRVSRDITPTFYTDYRVEVWSTSSPVLWTPIVLGVLAIFALIITWKIIEEVKGIDWGSIPSPVQWGTPIVAGLAIIFGILLLRRVAW